MSNIHLLYQHLFEHPEILRGLFEYVVAEDWVRQLNFDERERVDTEIQSFDWDRHDNILAYRLFDEADKRAIILCIIFVYTPLSESWISSHIWFYIGSLYKYGVLKDQCHLNTKLPPVIPLVLYHDEYAIDSTHEPIRLIGQEHDGLLQNRQPQAPYFFVDVYRLIYRHPASLVSAMFEIISSHSNRETEDGVNNLCRASTNIRATLKQHLHQWVRAFLRARRCRVLNDLLLPSRIEGYVLFSDRLAQLQQQIERKISKN